MCNANIKLCFLFNYSGHNYDVKMNKLVSCQGNTRQQLSSSCVDWVSEEPLQRFRGQAKTSTMRDFIVRALDWEATKSNETDGSDQNC